MRNCFFIWLLCTCLPCTVFGQASVVIDLSVPNIKANLANKIAYFEDKTAQMSISEVIKNFDQQKKILPTNQANFYQSPSTFWFKFEIRHHKFDEQDWLAEVPYPPLDYVDFYYQDKQKKWQVERSGDRGLFSQKSIKSKINAFKLVFHSDSVHTFYISVNTHGILQIPFNFQEINQFFADTAYEEAFLGIFYGMMLGLALYNLFLFFVLLDTAYIWYAGYMLFSVLFTASLIGHTFQYLFFDYPILIEPVLVISGCMLVFSVCNFIQIFLNTKQNIYRGHIGLQIVKAVALLNILLFFVVGYTLTTRILNILAPVTVLAIIVISIHATFKKIPAAKFLTLAFISMVIGTVAYALMQLSYLPHNLLTVHAPRFGICFQGLLFSLALADRYRQLRRQLLEQERAENEKLEKRVKERTEQLDILHKELITQNEELQQTQEEIMAQRDAIEQKNRELGNQNAQIQNSIRAAKVIQKAIVPYQQKRDELLRDYFVIYRPRDVVSGDFYWLNKINDSIFLSVIDCTGHGVPGAFMTLITNNLLDKIVRVWDIHSPSTILKRLHEEVQIMLRQKETENSYGMDMCFIVATPQDNTHYKITFAGAKQNAYYIPTNTTEVKILTGNRKSIGGFQRADIDFENQEIMLEKGSKLYLTSDGYLDQNDVKRRKIGQKQFMQLLTEMNQQDMPTQKQILIKYLYTFMQDTTQRDDILVIGININ